MKVKCPKDVCSLSIGGEEFTVKKGFIDLPDDGNYLSMLPAGFEVVQSEPAPVFVEPDPSPADPTDSLIAE